VGHSRDRGTAPIFATTKEEWLAAIHNAIAYAKKQGKPSEHTMLLRRLRIYTLTVACPVAGSITIADCPACFSRMALDYGPGAGRCGTDGRGPPGCGAKLWCLGLRILLASFSYSADVAPMSFSTLAS
jgi:hypothetical protein